MVGWDQDWFQDWQSGWEDGTTYQRLETLSLSPAAIAAEYLIETSGSMVRYDSGSSWPLFVSHMPDGPNVPTDCGCIYDTSGVLDGKLMAGIVIEHPGIQLRVRSRDYQTGWAKIEATALVLDAINYDTLTKNSLEYELQNFSRTSGIVSLGLERGTNRRFLFTVNFAVTIKQIILQ